MAALEQWEEPDQEAWLDAYLLDDSLAMMEAEFLQLVRVARSFSERAARQRPAPSAPSAVEIISSLARELLPNGPAPSLSDALHALDLLYAAWQGESEPFRRAQARRLAWHGGYLSLLRAVVV